MKKIMMLSVVLAGCLMGSLVFAQTLPKPAESKAFRSFEEQAGLSPSMAAKAKQSREEMGNKQKALKAQIEALSENMKKELEADKPTRRKIEKAITALSARREEQLRNNMELVLRLREVMTLEQYKKAEDLRQASRARKEAQQQEKAKKQGVQKK